MVMTYVTQTQLIVYGFLMCQFLVFVFPQTTDQSTQSILLGADPQPSPADSADTQTPLGPPSAL